MLKKAGEPNYCSSKRLYNMWSIRAYYATEWVKLIQEFQLIKWEPESPNPLQLESKSMTLQRYDEKGVNSAADTSQRCLNKYGRISPKGKPVSYHWPSLNLA